VTESSAASSSEAILIDLDGVLGDTRPLWDDWLAGAAKVLGVDPAELPRDRGAAAAALDAAGAGNWRSLLERFAEGRAPVYLRPHAEVSAALRRLSASGHRLGVFTDAPPELASVALAQLGASRRLEAVEAGADALDALRARLGAQARLVSTRAELVAAADIA
jgi:phosphoglycolate phosphatase-like HAD superfamily hydrolase